MAHLDGRQWTRIVAAEDAIAAPGDQTVDEVREMGRKEPEDGQASPSGCQPPQDEESRFAPYEGPAILNEDHRIERVDGKSEPFLPMTADIRLQRRESEDAASIPFQNEPHGPIAQRAHAVVEHQRRPFRVSKVVRMLCQCQA